MVLYLEVLVMNEETNLLYIPTFGKANHSSASAVFVRLSINIPLDVIF